MWADSCPGKALASIVLYEKGSEVSAAAAAAQQQMVRAPGYQGPRVDQVVVHRRVARDGTAFAIVEWAAPSSRFFNGTCTPQQWLRPWPSPTHLNDDPPADKRHRPELVAGVAVPQRPSWLRPFTPGDPPRVIEVPATVTSTAHVLATVPPDYSLLTLNGLAPGAILNMLPLQQRVLPDLPPLYPSHMDS